VRDGAVVGAGFHERAGGPHAEVKALESAGDRAREADVAVTLEPCNHAGRTPPCTEALIDAGVKSVTIGMRDPNRGVVGGGMERLRAAGIAVTLAQDPSPFEELNEEWLHWLSTGRPFVRVKVALSLDGRPALLDGRRARITGRGGERVTMALRAASDAVVVGAHTLAVDDPALTVRTPDGIAEHQPRRIVLSRLSIPDASATVFTDGLGSVTVLISDAAALADAGHLHATGADVRAYPEASGIAGAMQALGEDGVVSALVEPGPGLFGALWDADVVDRVIVLHAGGIAGAAAPGLYPWAVEPTSHELERRLQPLEAGIASESVVAVWRRT
jgi:diaminohydroxyphosphoribosylaminopyrimidine deaminase/5-amino-6-(5-phosphoribosylamino)uracil reductase